MRTYESGATRDAEEGKHDYEAFLSPLVIQAYGAYMHKHRKQSDGTLRDGANWQKCFGEDHYGVCIKSLWRHLLDLWLLHRKFDARSSIDDAICGIMFNAMAYYHKLLQDRLKERARISQLTGDFHPLCVDLP